MITFNILIVGETYDMQKISPAQPYLIPLSDCDFTEDAITKALDRSKVNKTPNPDCIAPSLN